MKKSCPKSASETAVARAMAALAARPEFPTSATTKAQDLPSVGLLWAGGGRNWSSARSTPAETRGNLKVAIVRLVKVDSPWRAAVACPAALLGGWS